MTRTLVTGSAGRFGRSVVTALADAGHEVIGVDTAPGTPAEAAAVLPADLTDLGEAFEVMSRFRPDAVVHLAAIATPFSRTDAFTYKVNTQLAFNVCETATGLGVERIVIASSPTVIGYGTPAWAPAYLPIDEDHPVAPWNAYSLSKLVAEQVMATFARTSTAKLAAIRPCFVIAPEEWWRAHPVGTHDRRAAGPAEARRGVAVQLHRRPRRLRAGADPAGQTPRAAQRRGVLRGRGRRAGPRAPGRASPRINPATAGLAAGLTGSAPAFSSAKAGRLLGWQAKRSWRTEIGAL
ncbi:NAD-dependent epimerase/dehydratase family protein [Streptosporangium lutulentum]